MAQPTTTTTTPVDPFDRVAAAAHRLHVNLDDTGTVSEFLRQLAASSPQLAAALNRAKQQRDQAPTVHEPAHQVETTWSSTDGHSVWCRCGATFDGFPTLDEATEAINHHIDGFKPANWQTRPCPAWCIGGHSDGQFVEDRVHYGPDPARIPLTLHDPVGPFVTAAPGEDGNRYEPAHAWVDVEQHVNAVAPTVKVGIGDKTAFLNLTVDEADQLRGELAAMVARLR